MNWFIKKTARKVPVIIVASGTGSRMAFLTGNIYPKMLCTIGQETLFSKILKSIEPICSNLIIIGNKNDNEILANWYAKNCHSTFPIEFFEHNECDGSWKALAHFWQTHKEMGECILHWSDIAYEFDSKLPISKDQNTVFVYASNLSRQCRYGISGSKMELGHPDENVFGIYHCMDFDHMIKNGISIIGLNYGVGMYMTDKINRPMDLAEVLSMKPLNITNVKEFSVKDWKIIDNGDKQKHLSIMQDASNENRYFNSISFHKLSIDKFAVDARGEKVMKREIEFYDFISRHDKMKRFPKVYGTSTIPKMMYISMERIYGMTLHEKLQQPEYKNPYISAYNLSDKTYKLISSAFKALDDIHHEHYISSVELKSTDFIEDFYEEYSKTTISRVEEIKMVLPKTPAYLITFDVEDKSKNPIIKRTLIDCSEDKFLANLKRFANIYENLVTDLALIHGDPNTKNIMVEKGGYIRLIDPRGLFGNSPRIGDITYDFGKLIYGLNGYSKFNHAKEISIEIDKFTSIPEFNMTKFVEKPFQQIIEFVYPYHNAVNDNQKELVYYWYIALIGIIYLKLTGYIKNAPTKSIFAYLNGAYLLETGLKHLEQLTKDSNKIRLFF